MKTNSVCRMMVCLSGCALLFGACGRNAVAPSSTAGSSLTENTAISALSSTQSAAASWALQNTLMKLDTEEIDGIDFTVGTEGGLESGTTSNAEEIRNIYDALCDLRLGTPTTMAVEDDSLFIRVRAGEKEYSFRFEHNITETADGRFEVENFSPLKRYILDLLEAYGDWGRADSEPVDQSIVPAPDNASGGRSAGKTAADKDVVIRPTEAQNVRLVSYSQPQGEFSMKIPEGWNVQNSGDYVSYRILVSDPAHPMRQIFIMLCGAGYQDRSVANMAQRYMTMGDSSYYMPVATTEGWWDGFFSTGGGSFTVHENLGKTGIGGDLLHATATDASGNSSEGLFTGVVYSIDIYTGMNFSMTVGEAMQCITADPYEFTDWEPVLLESLCSISFSDAFWQNRAANWQQIMNNASYISNTWNNISNMVMNSYERRSGSQDIMMQEWSDAKLGYERIVDTQTGETYKASIGFMDAYTGTRYKKVEQGSGLYNQAVSGYIDLK